ncbi:GNAT family acetyltransferase [Kosmotoga pacifica]|uniref:GNAT family acetyltransferase n=2 Tax=Kosmotoga pacifica TaxID=1330330 RepID=A0A0G2ZFA2_9BACT|nr:GNAT family acetyltransferase [Kosmotoga pacifica]
MYLIEDSKDFNETVNKEKLVAFLHEHLGKYGDPKEDIEKSIDYALSDEEGMGGFILVACKEDEIVGGLVINNTGMGGYIPKHVLVYVAVHKEMRGKGIGGELVNSALERCDGDVALHVEYDNPAKRLYKRLGFKSKYAEMRYHKKIETIKNDKK